MATKKAEGAKKTVKAKAAPKKEPEKKVAAKTKQGVAAPAEKKVGAPKKTVAAAKAATPAKAKAATKVAKKAATKKGARYECPECGMAVIVETVCTCSGECDLICCGERMILY
jgi:hypothetical protein